MKVLFVDGMIIKSGLANLGLGFLAQYIRKKHFVKIVSLAYQNLESVLLIARDFDIIGFSCLTDQYLNCLNIARILKKKYPRKFIVFGGIHPTSMPFETMKNQEIDFVCLGESEISLPFLLDIIENGSGNFIDVPGLVYRNNNGNIQQTMPKFIENLDMVGMPAWDLLERNKVSKKRNVITSRGCPFTCSYCYNSTFRKKFDFKFRRRSVESVIDECAYLKSEGANYIAFSDDLFLVNVEWLDKFSELYGKQVGISFGFAARPELVLRYDRQLRQLKRVGLTDVWIGIESGNENIRRKILNRKMSNKDIIAAFRAIKRLNLLSKSYNLVGIPTEGLREALDTFIINLRVRPKYTSHYTLIPYPKTAIWDFADKMNLFVSKRNYFSDELNIQSENLISMGPLHTGKLNSYQILALRYLWRVFFLSARFYRLDLRLRYFLYFLYWYAKGLIRKKMAKGNEGFTVRED